MPPIFTDDFSLYDLASAPASNPLSIDLDSVLAVYRRAPSMNGDIVAVDSTRALRFNRGNTYGSAYVYRQAQLGSTTDMRVTARIRTPAALSVIGAHRFGIAIRGAFGASPEQVFSVNFWGDSPTRHGIQIARWSGFGTIGPAEILVSGTGFTWALSTWYELEVTAVGGLLRGVVYADGDLGGDALSTVEATVTAADFGRFAGFVLLSDPNLNAAMWASDLSIEWDYAPPAVPGPRVPTDRFRLSVNADSRSLLASKSAVPFDTSVTLSLPPAVGRLPQQTLYQVREITRDATDTTFDAAFYPRATQNTLQERTYEGVTLLTLMRSAFPAPVNATAASLGIADPTSQNLINYLCTTWATQFPWFDFEPIPDLRTAVPGENGVAVPSEYDSDLGVMRSGVLAFPQTRDDRASAFDILEAMLSPFPGAVFFGNAAGRLQIVPVYGPDADEVPHKTLTDDDIVSGSLGEPSVSTIKNRATVASRGRTLQTGVPIMQPSWFQIGAPNLQGSEPEEGLWFEPPNDRLNLQATEDGSILQESLPPAGGGIGGANMRWPLATSVVPAGPGVITDFEAVRYITAAYRVIENETSIVASGSDPLLLAGTESAVPFDGVSRQTIRWAATVQGQLCFINVTAQWDASTGAVLLVAKSALLDFTTGALPKRYSVIVEFTLNDASSAFVETTGVTATFGTVTDGDTIPGVGGINAIAESQTAFDVLEARVDVRGYVLNAEQAFDMARGFVLANISPRVIRDYELGWKGSTLVQFDDRGRLFGTPGNGEGLLVGVSYADDFISVTGGKSIRIEETIAGAPGGIPTSTVYLLNESRRSLWLNDDNTFSEPA